MNSKRLPPAALFLLLLVSLLAAGCATRPTVGGGRETTLLGGAVVVSTKSFQPTTQTTLAVDTTKLVGRGQPSGTRTSLLWGLVTFHDY